MNSQLNNWEYTVLLNNKTCLNRGWENNNTSSVLLQLHPLPMVAMVMGTVSPVGRLWSAKLYLPIRAIVLSLLFYSANPSPIRRWLKIGSCSCHHSNRRRGDATYFSWAVYWTKGKWEGKLLQLGKIRTEMNCSIFSAETVKISAPLTFSQWSSANWTSETLFSSLWQQQTLRNSRDTLHSCLWAVN